MTTPGIPFIVSAPSGAGKTSLLRELVPADERLVMSVSHATRAMRPGEEQGVHYHFVSVERFEQLVGEGAFLEHARVFDNYYGTAEAGVAEASAAVAEALPANSRQAVTINTRRKSMIALFMIRSQ